MRLQQIRQDGVVLPPSYDAWNKALREDMLPKSVSYPMNIILWRIATCKALMGAKNAECYYRKAISATDSNPENIPHYMARLAMKAECEGVMDSAKGTRREEKMASFAKDYQKLKECCHDILLAECDKIDSLLHFVDANGDDCKEVLRRITRSIPIL